MAKVSKTSRRELHLALLLLFAIGAVFLWQLPALLAGFPLKFPVLDAAKTFTETGLLPSGDGRLSALLFAFFHRFIAWNDLLGWINLSACALAAALLPFWWLCVRLFSTRIAWIATVIFTLMPLYWLQALHLNNYTFAFFFLILAGALFVEFWQRNHHTTALITSGIAFGLALACKDTFLIFLPALVVAFLVLESRALKAEHKWWHVWKFGRAEKEANRKRLISEIVLFLLAVGVVYTAPLVPQALSSDAPLNERIAMLVPISRGTPGSSEFYPDLYTFEFDREWYDAEVLRKRSEGQSTLENLQGQHRLVSFNVDTGVLTRLTSSIWLSLNSIPDFFFIDTVGGAFLWIFILLGAFSLYHAEKKPLLLALLGLLVWEQFALRFVLHFQRGHLMNDAWTLAILAAIGVVFAAEALQPAIKSAAKRTITSTTLAAILTLLVAFQLLQANRVQLARMYGRSGVLAEVALAEGLKQAPEDARIALPDYYSGFELISNRETLIFRTPTVQRLLNRDGTALEDAFTHYGITHIYLYDDELARQIRRRTRVEILEEPEEPAPKIKVSPFLRYLLHVIR